MTGIVVLSGTAIIDELSCIVYHSEALTYI